MMTTDGPVLRKKRWVIGQALLFTPLAAGSLALFTVAVIKIATGDTGYIVMLVVFGLFGSLFAHQALQYVLDIAARPVTMEGEVTKKWTKGNILFFLLPSFYIACGGKIFALTRRDYSSVLEEDRIRVHHYPHSLAVEQVERYDVSEKAWRPAYSEEAEIERLLQEAERRRR
jgi:hypothetical protein